jgi:DNA modification methylase
MVIPGKYLSTRSDKLFIRGTKRRKHKSRTDQVYQIIPHPAARRLQHVRWLCKWFGGASVLDPFGGSGTTAVACKVLGIPCILIEIEERFCELAVNRLRQGVLDLMESE